jgi:hypothetical protein
VVWSLPPTHVAKEVRDDGDQLQRGAFPQQRWVVKYSLQLEAAFHCRKRPVWVSWRLDETYIRVDGPYEDKNAL